MKTNEERKEYHRRYGVTLEFVESKYAEEGGRCAICGVSKPMYGGGITMLDFQSAVC